MAATSEWAGQKSFQNSLRNSSQSRNFKYPLCFSSHWKTHSAHLAARPDFMYDRAQVILMCSSRKASGQRCIYIWQEVRKACWFPSYSLGKAGGGGRLVGAGWTGVISAGQFSGDGGRIFAACMSFLRCWNPFRSLLTCFWVFSCVAKESAKACSSARNRSSLAVGTLGCVRSMVVTGLRREPERRNSQSRWGSEEYSGSDNLLKGNSELYGIGPLGRSYSDVRVTAELNLIRF